MGFHRLPQPASTLAFNNYTTSIRTMPWLRSQGPLQSTTPLKSGATPGSVQYKGSKGDENLAGVAGRTSLSRLRPSSSRPHRVKPVKSPSRSSSSMGVTPKEEPLDPLVALRCADALKALESELLLVKDWTPREFDMRKGKLVEQTITAITECEPHGGWAKFTCSPRIGTWMAEMTRHRATPSTQLDMSIFDKPPFVDEPVVKQEHPPTPPRTPSVSPLKSALKRRASDSGLQATISIGTPPTKRSKTVTTPLSLGRRLPSRTLPGRVEYPSRERSRRCGFSDRRIKEEPGSGAAFTAFEAAIFGTTANTNTTPTNPTTPKRTPSSQPTTPPHTASCPGTPTNGTRSVTRIREDQKERRAAQKAALDDIPRIREENAELKKTVANLAVAVKSQADTIRSMQDEHAKLKEAVNARIDGLQVDVHSGRGRGGAGVLFSLKPMLGALRGD
ncbi:hypothetical protein FA13DRAFT_1734834 [Coprinellus micaceus]|uniref:Uncharacterized protein n=1 Tax=Coprinellus micaceus TaxID=71717 RepID=A0A4Y7T4Y1_COPMI|nr:hypothetical protein FA13DRAFT_1734834 [Coprinellus micaceus]